MVETLTRSLQQLSVSRALFLDRDGVINHEIGYLHRQEDVRWVDGIFSLCRAAASLHYKIVVVTNQAGIARGYYTMADFEKLMQWMSAEFAVQGASLDGIYHCPYHPEHGIGDYRREHEDRKPQPGMLLRAARDLALDLKNSVLVGDRCTDIEAATSAGLHKAFFLVGTEPLPCRYPAMKIDHLSEVEHWLLQQKPHIAQAMSSRE